ncbi:MULTISPECIES: methylated-DNA--[protein]-cysteine S-methyltransferase [Anaerococcus]|uniref:Methylated-DNA--protein-cysteine methyltransferase n=1 Tax=Anaerococcus octavius TaxID=54007 RepID=A0A380WWP0_9FIRM|nr:MULTISPECIES: methylated-DNA--[protein]-cysteine S-methyltransferase [Anaerococcus]MDU2598619.1 methylated-DNA--[protein]-cysteine S-methyltransferase [Anaerococcus sp.]SUU93426.1 Methylated-DNA--protein-cysteine methyltransferase, inducible [Anaerococcus octavius]
MKTAYYKTKIGIIKLTYQEKIYKIELVEEVNSINEKTSQTDKVIKEINQYLSKYRKEFSIYDLVRLEGTRFQKEVWHELQNIPYGETKSYKEIAKNIGNENAVRAVASAIGKNPLMIIIPCHRVIGSDGKMHGYAYGINLKKYLLDLESKI